MKNLLNFWDELEPTFKTPTLLLLLNEEGVLLPQAASSRGKEFASSTKKLIQSLVSSEGIKMAVVSRRPLDELKKLLGVRGLIYMASQGLELEEPSGKFVHPHAAAAKKLMEKVWERLKKTLKPFSEIRLQDKNFTLSIRHRRVAKNKLDQARATFFRTVRPYLSSSQIVVKEAEGSWEVSPVLRWNKGTTLVWLYGKVLAQTTDSVLPIYVGDSSGDEDAFYSMKPLGIGVSVGEPSKEASAAPYYLRSTSEVLTFLKRILSNKAFSKKMAEGVLSA